MLRPLTCVALFLFFSTMGRQAVAADLPIHVLATTFPIYQLTRIVTNGVTGVETELMIPAAMGCPHDYALTPQDMQKLSRADILVINGLGMEEFLGAPIKKANPALTVIDSSEGITELLHYTGQKKKHPAHEGAEDHAAHHQHAGINPHLFASPKMSGQLAHAIAQQLGQERPAFRSHFITNAEAYQKKMATLAQTMAELGKHLTNNRIVTQHGVFDYLARDMGLEVVAVVQAHPGQEPSASEILDIVHTIREKKAGALFTEPQYPHAVGQTISREAQIPTAVLDPVATGPEQAPLDYYEQTMRTNIQTLEKTLGSN